MADLFTLEPLAARHGDCLLLHVGSAAKPLTILIDGGPSQVWNGSLKPRLTTLAAHRPGGAFAIELAMVSHIDDDHIRGLCDFTDDWRDAVTDHATWPFPIKQLWFNSFERIAGGDPHAVQASILASAGTDGFAAIAAEIDPDSHDQADALKILASVGQGSTLRNNAKTIKLPVNTGFAGGLVTSGAGPSDPFKMGDLELHVVGPLKQQIDDLRDEFAKELPKGPAAALQAYTDDSVPNLSSIVVLARYQGKTILLTGDARGDYIIDGLKAANLLDAAGKLHLDILKMPHHGSDRDVADDFFKTITADHYIASASGAYENPDRPTLEMIAKSRPKTDKYAIHLTYEVDAIDVLRKAEREKSIATAIKKHRTPPKTWSDQDDSLKAFFAKCKTAGYKFTVVTPASGPRQIDLLDKLAF